MKPALIQERVSELFEYNSDTGIFRWRVRGPNRKIGERAGGIHVKGYRQIRIDGFRYMEHCVAWLLVRGYWPKQLDHINLNKADNRICNLREATTSQNKANSKPRTDNLSGIKGVRKTKYSTWQARIRFHGKLIDLGYFKSAHEASNAYAVAAHKLYGEFARATNP